MFHGRVAGLRDAVTFKGDCVEALERAFGNPLTTRDRARRLTGRFPGNPWCGSIFGLRRKAAVAAERAGKSLSRWVVDTLTHETA